MVSGIIKSTMKQIQKRDYYVSDGLIPFILNDLQCCHYLRFFSYLIGRKFLICLRLSIQYCTKFLFNQSSALLERFFYLIFRICQTDVCKAKQCLAWPSFRQLQLALTGVCRKTFCIKFCSINRKTLAMCQILEHDECFYIYLIALVSIFSCTCK